MTDEGSYLAGGPIGSVTGVGRNTGPYQNASDCISTGTSARALVEGDFSTP